MPLSDQFRNLLNKYINQDSVAAQNPPQKSLMDPNATYDELSPEDQSTVSDSINSDLEKNPDLLKNWQNYGSPGGISQQYLQKQYSDVLPGQIMPADPAKNILQRMPSGAPDPAANAAFKADQVGAPKQDNSDVLNLVRNLPNSPQNQAMPAPQAPAPKEASEAAAPKAPVKPEAKPEEPGLDFAGTELGGVDKLRELQEEARKAKLANGILRGLDITSAGIVGSGAKPAGQEAFNQNIKAADEKVENHLKLIAEQKNDPDSAISVGFRKYAEKLLGKPITGKFTAADGEKIIPFVFKQYEAGLNRAERQSELKQRLDTSEKVAGIKAGQAQQARSEKQTAKDESELDKRFEKLNQKLTAEIASSRSAFGTSARTYSAAEKIQRLTQGRDPNSLTTREVAELARQLDTILSNGQPTISGMKKLIPETAAADVTKLAEYITNQSRGAQGGSFIKQMMETVNREKELSGEQVKRTQGKLLAGSTDLMKKDPDRWGTILAAHDLPDDVFKEPGKELKGLGSEFPKQVRKGGQVATVSNKQELEEATKEGWK